jgi:dTDP-4-dehydrorhamnose reductase
MFDSKKRVLVTGAAGQLGLSIKSLAPRYTDMRFFYTDIQDLDITSAEATDSYILNNKIDYIINCAAYTSVDKAESDNEAAYSINAEAVRNLALAARNHSAALIHISTDYVFGTIPANGLPFKEFDAVNPECVYGKTKLAGEEEARNTENHIIIRTSWLYSAYGSNFMNTMLKLGAEKSYLDVVYDQVGTPTYALDLADVILNIIRKESPRLENPGLYHYSNEGVCSWYDFATEIMLAAGLKCVVYPIDSVDYPTAAKRPAFSVMNKSKIRTTFKLINPHWRDAMQRCLAEIKANQ